MAESFLKNDGRELEITFQTLRHFERRWTEAIRSEGTTEPEEL
jgi:hypothetical protein